PPTRRAACQPCAREECMPDLTWYQAERRRWIAWTWLSVGVRQSWRRDGTRSAFASRGAVGGRLAMSRPSGQRRPPSVASLARRGQLVAGDAVVTLVRSMAVPAAFTPLLEVSGLVTEFR